MQVSLTFTEQAEQAIVKWCKDNAFKSVFVLCDSNTFEHCFPQVKNISDKCIVIPAGEDSKQFNTVEYVINELVKYGAKNTDVLINLGGGVVTDIGGFVASVYRRGMKFIHVPTSLMGMVDAAIGGKTGIDFRHLKNYIGTITQPETVVISAEFLKTLPQDEFDSAWAEIIKTASILDLQLFELIEQNTELNIILKKCAEAKKTVVVQDAFDKSIRQLLNFGHTIGHAYESHYLSIGQPVKHGIAVAKGMLFELQLASDLNFLSQENSKRISDLIHLKLGVDRINENEWFQLKQYLVSDKKNTDSKITFSFPTEIGSGRFGIKLNLGEIKWKG